MTSGENHSTGSAATSGATSTSTSTSKPAPEKSRRLGVEEIAFIALLVLSIGGMAVEDFSETAGLRYWLFVIPLFAAVSIYTGWRRASASGKNIGAVLASQVLHWGVLALAVYLIYLLERSGRLNQEDAGLVALLALSLTTVLAGIHFDWRLAVLGVLLAVATACAALVEEFFWILLIPAILVGAGAVLWQRLKS